MQPSNPPNPPPLSTLKSFSDVIAAIKNMFEYMRVHASSDQEFESAVSREVTYLYGEYSWAGATILFSDYATVLTVTVPGAIPGYCVDVAYDQDLEGLLVSSYVSAADTVKIILVNFNAADASPSAGKWRAFVWPRRFTS